MTEPSDQPGTQLPPPSPAQPAGAGYSAPPPMPYAGQRPHPAALHNGFGNAALVIAIIGLITCWIPLVGTILGVLLGIAAVVIGIVGRGRVKRGTANNGGMAMAGIVLGILTIVGALAFTAIWFAVFKPQGESIIVDCINEAGEFVVCAD